MLLRLRAVCQSACSNKTEMTKLAKFIVALALEIISAIWRMIFLAVVAVLASAEHPIATCWLIYLA